MKLLRIDDAPEMLRAFRDILEAYGCEVYEAENGQEGLVRYLEVKPDIVLMDILMPKLDGISATKKILIVSCLNSRSLLGLDLRNFSCSWLTKANSCPTIF